MKPILIGLAGPARSGKSTAADHLVRNHLLEHYAFADPLRSGLMEIFNLDPDDFEGAKKEQPVDWLGRSPRELMQSMGTEWARQMVHPDVWVKLAEQNLNYLQNSLSGVVGFVVSDVRFENEAEFIRQRGGTIAHIFRPNAQAVNPHISEAGIVVQPGDLAIYNDKCVSALRVKIDTCVEAVRRSMQARTAA
ncbi:deoxynucleotide monophosphate kinase [Pseudomonas chlororaphis subsp. aurantiaca]|uniref:deoxynucleotide monophosphate kinase family protein n=1 Tax=Pseudomonas chlororaphis TaxID=587753 RepID=UPI0027DDD3CF|nr:deoxynucleotide monophosphate kinase [Pseudomonas chlororaphis]WMJ01372.1 deoxynucleotide monophosphate kinase [Pseudomonas chlororaphis subsp. aurantiaca]